MLSSFILFLANCLPRDRYSIQVRVRLMRLAGVRIGRSVVVAGPVTIPPLGATGSIAIGSKSYLGAFVRFGGRAGVSIGNFVQIAPNVSFDTASHTIEFTEGEARPTIQRPIRVEDHVWIGTGALILPGVTIGRGAVIAAGAVVIRDVEPMTVVGGVPARVISQVIELPHR